MLPTRLLMTLVLAATPAAGAAQTPADFRKEFLLQFDASMEKFIALAEAMPADKFTWAPGPGVMPVGHVYMHVAHYNYGYPSANLGLPAPAGVNLKTMEEIREKAQVVKALRESGDYVRAAANQIGADQLAQPTELYGRQVPQWSVFLQLLAHMNEHLGQSIAYARMNQIVPPWSR